MQDVQLVGEVYNTHFAPEPDFGRAATVLFRLYFDLPAGAYACLLQTQSPEAASPARVRFTAADAGSGAEFARIETEIGPDARAALDDSVLRFELARPALVEIAGVAAGLQPPPRLRHARLLRTPSLNFATRESFRDNRFPFTTDRLHSVIVGTTNHCNASCGHCPANKPMLAGVPVGVMSARVFDDLLEGLREMAFEGPFWFGVFGEPFADPTFEEKVAALRRRFPHNRVGVSTNAAAVDLTAAPRLFDLISTMQIHVEAVSPARYDRLMTPLRAADVLPKVDALAQAFPAQVEIHTPLHRDNLAEAHPLRERFGDKGVRVTFAPLRSRSTPRTGAAKMALWPVPGFWLANLVDVLTVDWDGTVLATCDDFLRRQPLGSLARQSLPEILAGAPRRALHDDLSHFRWAHLPSLRDAVCDSFAKLEAQAAAAQGASTWRRVAPPHSFRLRPDVRWEGDLVVVDPAAADAPELPAIYGPYLWLPAGQYCVEMSIACDDSAPNRIACEVFVLGHRSYARADFPPGAETLRLTFTHDRADMAVEFRTFVESVAARSQLRFGGATLFRMG